jgi:hypothetical protein
VRAGLLITKAGFHCSIASCIWLMDAQKLWWGKLAGQVKMSMLFFGMKSFGAEIQPEILARSCTGPLISDA